MKKNSKRYNEIFKNSIRDKKVEIKEALELVKKNATTKFDESIDVSLRINLKQTKGGDFSLRTVVNLPNGSGKKIKLQFYANQKKLMKLKKQVQILLVLMILLKKLPQENLILQNLFVRRA